MTQQQNKWDSVELSAVVRCQGGSAFSPSLQGRPHGDIPFYKVSDMNTPGNQWLMRRAANYISTADKERINGDEKPAGAVIFPKVGGAIFTNKKRLLSTPAFVDNNVMAVWPSDSSRCSPRYLYLYFLTKTLSAFSNPGPLPSINNGKIYEQTILLPSVVEQEKIADVLWKVQDAIDVEGKLLDIARNLKHTAMNQIFAKGLKREELSESEIGLVPKSWQVFAIREKAKLVAGGTPSRGIAEYWTAGAIPWVKTGEIDYCIIAETEERITDAALKNSATKLLPKGALLLAMYGQGVTRGKVAILGIDAATNQACVAILPKTTDVSSWFLYYYLTAKYEDIRGLSHGANQQNLNSDLVGGFKFPVPPQDEQNEIVSILRVIDRKIQIHEQKYAMLQELFTTLLHKLTSGDILLGDSELRASKAVTR